MANVNIIIADVFELSTAGKFKQAMIDRVSSLYKQCIDSANAKLPPNQKHTFKVMVADTAKPTVTELDFIIYLLPIEMSSIVRKKNGMPSESNLLASHWGFTMMHRDGSSVSGESEMIHKVSDGEALGSIVFHELLHYKSEKGNQALHASGGLGAATVMGNTSLNPANISDIASTIEKKITPWLGGWDLVADRLALKKSNPALYEADL